MFSKRIGIDLGTANSLVWLAGKGVVLNEPTVVAVTEDDGKVVAVGNDAKEMLGRTPVNIRATRPLRDGVIADYRITEAMLRYFIDQVIGKNRIFKPEVMICVPTGVTQVERRAVLDATLSAGAKIAYLIEQPLAAAIGAKIPIAQASGHMIVDIGGGSTECAVISLGGVVVHKSVRVGGNKLDESITQYIKKRYNLIIGERTAEIIKMTVGDAMGDKIEDKRQKSEDRSREEREEKKEEMARQEEEKRKKEEAKRKEQEEKEERERQEKEKTSTYSYGKPKHAKIFVPTALEDPRVHVGTRGQKLEDKDQGLQILEVRGRDAISGLPRMIEITPQEVSMAMGPVLRQMVSTVKAVLEDTPPELAADIIDKGIVMAGGTSTMKNLDKLLTLETGVPCHVAEDALLCVVRGTGIAVENIELYKRSVNKK